MKTYSEAKQGYVGIKVDILILTVGSYRADLQLITFIGC